ncbi:MAG: recombination mediator RecR [Dehalococcoidia bacterium]
MNQNNKASISSIISELISHLSQLPGIGPKTAERLAFHIVKAPESKIISLSQSLVKAKQMLTFCKSCFIVTENDPCSICSNEFRDKSTLCVVHDSIDAFAIENTNTYSGRYHILNGSISPINGIGPQELTISNLLERINNDPPKEIIIATNPTIEGDATSTYIINQISNTEINISRLAIGIPIGGDLDYTDNKTLIQAFNSRQSIR